MKRLTLRLAAFISIFLCLHTVSAQYLANGVVTTAVPFLRISPDARAGGMGDLGVATSPDANSSFYNLSKTPFSKHDYGIGLTYTPWLKDLGLNDVYLLSAAGFYKLDENQAISASLRYFSLGNIQFTDYSGNTLGQGQPREYGADFGYSRKLSSRMSVGLALRYIHSNLAAGYASNGQTYKPGNSVAGDISLFYNMQNDNGQGWTFGATMTNLGNKIGYTNDATEKDYIPASLNLGTCYTAVFDEQNKISFGVDLHKLLVPSPPQPTNNSSTDSANLITYRDKTVVSSWFSSFSGPNQLKLIDVSLGAEYSYQDQFFVRVGYFYEDPSQGDRKYFTAGVGLKYNVIGLNFSYLVPSGNGVTRNPLSNTIRFGLVFDLDNNSGSNSGSTTTPAQTNQ
ncbi:MAG TPA: type IX secretion system outer membrane channel protein PorV [Puia sp.]|nr:type IX secretion system outer membrane channel protein PorV [Puia sp.]